MIKYEIKSHPACIQFINHFSEWANDSNICHCICYNWCATISISFLKFINILSQYIYVFLCESEGFHNRHNWRISVDCTLWWGLSFWHAEIRFHEKSGAQLKIKDGRVSELDEWLLQTYSDRRHHCIHVCTLGELCISDIIYYNFGTFLLGQVIIFRTLYKALRQAMLIWK